ncbi:MAG: S8 family serine peptidase, partial [Planctomycetota bacterium]
MLSIIASLSILLSTLPATPQTASPEKAASPEKGTSPDSSFTVPGTTTAIELFEKGGRSWYRVSFDRGRTWHAAQAAQPEIHLSYASFDPLVQEPRVDKALLASPLSRLFIVQFRTQVFEAYLRHLRNLGVEVHHYLPMQAYLVRMAPSRAQAVRALRYVRWVGPLHAAYKIDPVVLARARVSRDTAGRRYDVGLVAGDRDRSALIASIESIGGKIDHPNPGNVLLEATLDPEQLVRVAGMDEVTWIDYSGPPEEDMNNARIFGGANYIEFKSPLRYTGKGVRGHIMEGIYPNHREFTATSPWRGAPVGFRNTSPSTHGTATFGVVFAKGVSPTARGLCPDGQGYFTHYAYVFNGYGVRKTLVADLQRLYGVMFQTASWGYSRTTVYTNRSQEMDDLIFDLDIPITQSQSNAGATPSRPQAWAKNILSIGGIRHYNTLTPTDDRWARAGSTGPASDMRIKPTLCGYYDSIYTTYSSTGYGQFGGTSGATPINAGHVGLQLEMWTDGIFGYPMQPGGWQARFKNRPHFTTTKAMLVNFAWQYPFSASWHDLSRYKQGWGWPNVQKMYDQRDRVLVINEQDVLRNLGSKRYRVFVKSGAPELKVTMTYNDPAQIPTSGITRINDVDLKVTAPNNTTVYHGNNGLVSGNYSSPGGVKNG